MKRVGLERMVVLGVVIASVPGVSQAVADEPTPEGFRGPPRQFSMVPLWSWNGRLDPNALRWQIDQMVDKGVYGAFMHARAGINLDSTPYFSDGWWRAVEACVEHGAKVGFATWLYDEDKWPSGAAGGRTLKANPVRNCRKGLRRVEVRVSGPKDVVVRVPGAAYVIAGRVMKDRSVDPDSLVDVTSHNVAEARAVDPAPTAGLRVAVVTAWTQRLLTANCRRLGCQVSTVPLDDAGRIDLDKADVLVSDVGTQGVGVPKDKLLAWIRRGGGYIDFSHSEPTDPLYDVSMTVKPDAADHRWLLRDHPIASVPNPDPDADYTGRRWSDQWWRGGDDFDAFDHVLADPRWDPPGVSILARREGKGHVVYCGATQACREDGGHVELLQNLLVYAAGRSGKVAARPVRTPPGKPAWKCPAGQWILFGYVPQTSEEVNYLNAKTVRDFMDITHEAYARRVGEHFGKTIPGVFFDEIHNSGMQIVWVEGFRERFRALKGYDLIPLLPALSADVGPRTPKIRCDYYDVYTTLYEEAWFRQISQWCEQHNLALTGHTIEGIDAYKTQGCYFRTIRHLQIPGTDNEDFRYRWPRWIDPWKPKQLASISHLYDRPLAGVEAMGGAGWAFTLDMGRYGFNLLAAYGINFYMSHLFHYAQDKPTNVDDWPNSWFFRNPYWKYFKTFADHGSRLSYMLTGGTHVADVAVLYPITNLWTGEGGGTACPTVAALVARHVDCDLLDPDSLARATVDDGRLVIGEQRYRVLIIPGVRCVRRVTAEKTRAFIAGGGIVIVHDRWPSDSMEAGRDDPAVARLRTYAEAKGIRPSALKDTVEQIARAIDRDVIVRGEHAEKLRYHHVRRGAMDVYWLANDSRQRRTWRVSFRATGSVSLWQPEDGSIRTPGLYDAAAGRTECDVVLDGWQGCFVVIRRESARPPGGMLVDRTNLVAPRLVKRDETAAEIAGMLPPGQDVASVEGTLRGKDGRRAVQGSHRVEPAPKTIELDGPWRFLPVGDVLDHDWRVDVKRTELAVPVMRVRWEDGVDGRSVGWHKPDLDDGRWRQIKVLDAFHRDEGAARYRSRWEGRFISHYDYSGFHTRIGGKKLRCRKRIGLPSAAKAGWLAVVCESPFRATIGGKTFQGKGGTEPQRFDLESLPAGELTITVMADNAQAILAEGRIALADGTAVKAFTDATWEASMDGRKWAGAWEYVAPPEKPYGEPTYPAKRPPARVVWYRQALPFGAVSIAAPKIDGDWQAWIDGQPLQFADGKATLPRGEGARVLAIRVDTNGSAPGLLEPVRLDLEPVPRPLGSWTDERLAWYSGRAIYGSTFTLTDDHRRDGLRLRLDLGQVCYCAEVWVNGKLVGPRVWPPHALDVTEHVRVGENRVDVVVANLLANRMRWDIFDDVKAKQWNRKWHDGNIRRDAWCLASGLIGPVRIVPMREVTVQVQPR